jgi:HAD superfamily hydrolase (TIGR01549 family)
MAAAAADGRWVCLDVGETLIDETRIWSTWADALEIPRLTFMAAFGATIARGGDHRDVARMFDRPDWQAVGPEVERRYGGFTSEDLYPDAIESVHVLRNVGYRVGVFANQPAARTADLRSLGVDVEVMAMSGELGVTKPAPEFFTRALELMGDPLPAHVAYVGDRLDNDIIPAAAAGMRPVWLRRGPWGLCASGQPPDGTLVISSLSELVDRLPAVWPARIR